MLRAIKTKRIKKHDIIYLFFLKPSASFDKNGDKVDSVDSVGHPE
jgi:hypothetical protein